MVVKQTGPVPMTPGPVVKGYGGNGSRQTFQTVTTGNSVQTPQELYISTDFSVNSIRVTNLSGHWLIVPIANNYVIPPFTIGAILWLPFPTREIAINANIPSGTAGSAANGLLLVTVYEDVIPDFPGIQQSPSIKNIAGTTAAATDIEGVLGLAVVNLSLDGFGFNPITASQASMLVSAAGYVYDDTNASIDRMRETPAADNKNRTGVLGTALLAKNSSTTLSGAYDRIQGDATKGLMISQRASDHNATQQGGANAAATLTLPAPPAGLTHFITFLRITRVSTAALAGAALLTVTTTNLPGTLSFRCGNNMGAGDTQDLIKQSFNPPLVAFAPATATTFVAPAPGAAVSWDMEAAWFEAPNN